MVRLSLIQLIRIHIWVAQGASGTAQDTEQRNGKSARRVTPTSGFLASSSEVDYGADPLEMLARPGPWMLI